MVLTTALAATTAWSGNTQLPQQDPSASSLPSVAQTTGANPDDQQPDGEEPDDGRITIRSDQQEIDEEEGILTAEGRVRITYPAHNITATADHARYFTREGRLVLSGNVEVRQKGGNSIRGERLVYTESSRNFVVEAKPGEQVHSTYDLSAPQQEESAP